MDNAERTATRPRITLRTFVLRIGEAAPVEMVDASYKGIMLRFAEPPRQDALLKLRIELPARQLVVHAVVVHVAAHPSGLTDVGLRFFAFDGADRMDWESYVSAVMTTAGRRAA